ncbi:MAG: hypothetical protein M1829_004120 [Trizodia sp. TS-e1964]|nr:MAG: hypothetical protein M1829_004120 [Trizodia sp. TS-e1964]
MAPSHPRLLHGSTTIGGFRNILQFLWGRKGAVGTLAGRPPPAQEDADCYAFTSFIESAGQPLLDLSLYVSTENFAAVTRPLYSSLLPWPTQYIIPAKIRAAAKARSAHLGLSGLDIDSAANDDGRVLDSASAQIPASLLHRPRQTLTGLLAAPQHASQFQLQALTNAFFAPLDELLGDKRYLLGTSAASPLDCVAVAYLSLALYPKLPHAWLSASLISKFPRLHRYVDALRPQFFGGPVSVASMPPLTSIPSEMRPSAEEAKAAAAIAVLPWYEPPSSRVPPAISLLAASVLHSAPLRYLLPSQAASSKAISKTVSTNSSVPLTVALTVGASLSLLLSWTLLASHLPSRRPASNYSDLGETGRIFAALGKRSRAW